MKTNNTGFSGYWENEAQCFISNYREEKIKKRVSHLIDHRQEKYFEPVTYTNGLQTWSSKCFNFQSILFGLKVEFLKVEFQSAYKQESELIIYKVVLFPYRV